MTLFTDDDPRDILPFDGAARYIPSFISADEADNHFTGLIEETPWEHRHIVLFGKEVLQPRLACWYGDHAYSYSGIRLESRAWTERLRLLRDHCSVASGVEFNSCLVNLYRDGRDSMGWHADDEPELDPDAPIASLSLGATRTFQLRPRQPIDGLRPTVSLELGDGDLLLMDPPTQQHWLHQLPQRLRVREARLNLTFRLVRPRG